VNQPTITFSGNLAAKPQLRPVDGQNGPVVVAKLRVAVTPRRRGRGADEWVDLETIWFNVSAWRGAAANCATSLNQGDRVLVQGRLRQRSYTDADGVERTSLDVDATDVGLDLARHPAMSLRRPPAQRVEGETGAGAPDVGDGPADEGADDAWESGLDVDRMTGEVRRSSDADGLVQDEHGAVAPAL
jgi:single-strand DNA-binding protein